MATKKVEAPVEDYPAWWDPTGGEDGTGGPYPVTILIGKILADLPAIGKEQQNKEQGFMFRGHDDVMNALNPLLSKYGVFYTPDVVERITEKRTTKSGTTMYEVNLHVRFMATGPKGDYVVGSAWGEGTDMGDKATNKAMTNAFKYFLVQQYAISTREVSETDADRATPDETIVDEATCPKCDAIIKGAATDKEPMRAHYIEAHGYVRQADGTVAQAGTNTGDAPATPPAATPAAPAPDAAPSEPTPDPVQPDDPQAGDNDGDDATPEDDLSWVDALKGQALKDTAKSMEVAVSGTVPEIKERIKEAIRLEEAAAAAAAESDASAEDPEATDTATPDDEPATDEPDTEADLEEGENPEGEYECPDCLKSFDTNENYEAHWERAHGGGDEEEPEAEGGAEATDEGPTEDDGPPDEAMLGEIKSMIGKLAGQNARAYARYRKENALPLPDALNAGQAEALHTFLQAL